MINSLLFSAVISSVNVGDGRILNIESDSATHNRKAHSSTWRGDVTVKEGDYQIKADSIEVKYNASKEPVLITAIGNTVKAHGPAQQDMIYIEGNTVIYNRAANTVSSHKQAKLHREDQTMAADNIIYNFINKTVAANTNDDDGRSRVTIPANSRD